MGLALTKGPGTLCPPVHSGGCMCRSLRCNSGLRCGALLRGSRSGRNPREAGRQLCAPGHPEPSRASSMSQVAGVWPGEGKVLWSGCTHTGKLSSPTSLAPEPPSLLCPVPSCAARPHRGPGCPRAICGLLPPALRDSDSQAVGSAPPPCHCSSGPCASCLGSCSQGFLPTFGAGISQVDPVGLTGASS